MLKILKYNNKNISIKINNKKYNLHAQWLYENSHNTLIRDPYTNQLLIEVAEISKNFCLLYTSPSPRDRTRSRMPSSA